MQYEADRVRLDEGSADCLTLVEQCLGRVDARSSLNAFTVVDAEGARNAARQVDERRASGDHREFDGLILAVKDTISVLGLPLSCASRLLEGFTAEFDATVVSRLRDKGAIVIGKTNCDEFGMGSSSEYSVHGRVLGPLDPSLSAGGSSGGSAAAVAAGLCHVALGSDTGGSVRQPAAFCSVVGLKPSWGRVSRYGLTAFASSMDTIGFITPDAGLAGRLAAAVEGSDGHEAICSAPEEEGASIRDVRTVGVVGRFSSGRSDDLNPVVTASLGRAVRLLEDDGLSVQDESLPGLSSGVGIYHALTSVEAASNLARFDGVRYGRRGSSLGTDSSRDSRRFFDAITQARSEGFGEEVRRRILLGTWLSSRSDSAERLERARRVRARISRDLDALFDRVDIVISPTTCASPFRLGAHSERPASMYEQDVWTIPASLAGCPAISIPVPPYGPGEDESIDRRRTGPPGWAPGIQVIGPRHSDRLVTTFAARMQKLGG